MCQEQARGTGARTRWIVVAVGLVLALIIAYEWQPLVAPAPTPTKATDSAAPAARPTAQTAQEKPQSQQDGLQQARQGFARALEQQVDAPANPTPEPAATSDNGDPSLPPPSPSEVRVQERLRGEQRTNTLGY
jgi:hypothetical protein